VKWVSQLRLPELINFKASLEQLQCKHHRRLPEIGRGEAYLSIGSILSQFEACSSIFIHLKVSTRSAENLKI
jgi:hypothetical protein